MDEGDDLSVLLARVEGAAGPNFALEQAIHAALFPPAVGGTFPDGTPIPAGWGGGFEPPITASLDAALALCERVLPGFHVLAASCGSPPGSGVESARWRASLKGDYDFVSGQPRVTITTEPLATAPLALCAAILRALSSIRSNDHG